MSAPQPGQILAGRYRVERALGQGGMGAVLEAVQLDLGRRVALKVLLPELGEEPLYVERFRREAQAAAGLMHPHIVQVQDFVCTPGEPVIIVMELLRGEALVEPLRRGPLDVGHACRIAVQLASALDAAHGAGIVHRDLKPQNVFLVPVEGGEPIVKLLDFGVAKLSESRGHARLTQTGVLVGTPRFASPEQVMGKRDVDARSDIFSLGVLLYAMLTAKPPFSSSGTQLLIDIQDREAPDPRVHVPGLPPELVAIVLRAMRKAPAERYASAREMGAAIERFLGAGSDARQPSQPDMRALTRERAAGAYVSSPALPEPHAAARMATAARSAAGTALVASSPVGWPAAGASASAPAFHATQPQSAYQPYEDPFAPARPKRSKLRTGCVVLSLLVAFLLLAGALVAAAVLIVVHLEEESWRPRNGDDSDESGAEPTEGHDDEASPASAASMGAGSLAQTVVTAEPSPIAPSAGAATFSPSPAALRIGPACVEMERHACSCPGAMHGGRPVCDWVREFSANMEQRILPSPHLPPGAAEDGCRSNDDRIFVCEVVPAPIGHERDRVIRIRETARSVGSACAEWERRACRCTPDACLAARAAIEQGTTIAGCDAGARALPCPAPVE